MRVQRTIAMNPIEPAQMSLRLPSGMPLTLDMQYLDLAGAKINGDLAAQLQLTGRSNDVTDFYQAPATDLVNGQARVSIGEDVLTDMNGYRMRLTGTYKGEPTLLALGTLRITEAAGIEAVPQDVIDNVPLNLVKNQNAGIYVNLWKDSDKGTPFDLTSATISAAVYANATTSTALVPFVVTITGQPGQVLLSLTMAQVNALPPICWWSLRASNAAGLTTLCQGTVTIT